MFVKNSKLVYFLFIMINIVKIIASSKCGDFFCDDKSECKYIPEKSELSCVCGVGYARHVEEKKVFCSSAEILENEGNCLQIGDKCGAYHECNEDLVCEEVANQNVEVIQAALEDTVCHDEEQKCLDKCCSVSEICKDGKLCIAEEKVIAECAEFQKCGAECCAQNEFCDKNNVCVAKGNLVVGQIDVASLCVASRQCQDKCCKENEVCLNSKECINKESENAQCPQSQKCQNICCSLSEICQNNTQCVPSKEVPVQCSEHLLCRGKCCAESEICDEENKCVSKEKFYKIAEQSYHQDTLECSESQQCLDKCCDINEKCGNMGECISSEPFMSECPETLQCHDKCCNENEICINEYECVSKIPVDFTCPEFRKCHNKCCEVKQICNQYQECVDEAAPFSQPNTSIYDFQSCPLLQQCQYKCCSKLEKCNEIYECIPIVHFDCPESERCANKCCPVNETCNDGNECVPYIEVVVIPLDCLPKQNCQDVCCSAQEVCSDLKKCVNKNFLEISNLYDFKNENPVESKTPEINDFDAVVPLYDINNFQENTSCPNDHQPCQDKCCTADQICNTMGQCITKLAATDCVSEGNCTESARVTDDRVSLAYTMIGLGCLVAVFSIGLFKIYVFKRANVF